RALTARTFDPYQTGAVTMDNLVKLGDLVADLVQWMHYSGGGPDADRQVVQAALEILKQNRLAPTLLSGTGLSSAVRTTSLSA
ncbi:MAG: hypothetical protein JO318_02820, partial [Chloroflexi bacterium]|nr:hypothetical protein [Chloroflexota bacterium]